MTRRSLRSRPLLRIGLAIGVLGVAAAWYVSQADERRVNETCDQWVAVRSSLRSALTEVDDGLGRAFEAEASSVGEYVGDLETTQAALDRGRDLGGKSLDRDSDSLEGDAATAFSVLSEGYDDLLLLLESGSLDEVEFWVDEIPARDQFVGDVCLAAAR